MKYILPLLFFFGVTTWFIPTPSINAVFMEQIPSHVQSIEQENTAQQKNREFIDVERTALTQKWIEESDLKITNPYLINQLNETEVKRSFFAFSYSSEVYLGRWPLFYQSTESSVNWNYQKINNNYVAKEVINYFQNEDQLISGGLHSQVSNSEQVQNMILEDTRKRIVWPIDYQATFGAQTKKQISMTNSSGSEQLEAYGGAVKETGTVTYGEVYLSMTGRKQELIVKNVVEQEVTAWLPVQNYLAFHLK